MVYIAPALPIPEWLPDDTDDSIVGVEWHQEAIGALAYALRVVSASWGVSEQAEACSKDWQPCCKHLMSMLI